MFSPNVGFDLLWSGGGAREAEGMLFKVISDNLFFFFLWIILAGLHVLEDF